MLAGYYRHIHNADYLGDKIIENTIWRGMFEYREWYFTEAVGLVINKLFLFKLETHMYIS